MKVPHNPTPQAGPVHDERETVERLQLSLTDSAHYTMHLIAQPERDVEAATRAVERIKEIGRKYAPSRTQGATTTVRKLRDRGE